MRTILIITVSFIIGLSIGHLMKKTNPYPDWSYCDGLADRFVKYIDAHP